MSPHLPSRQSGGRVRLHGLASRIAGSHSVSILCFSHPDEAPLDPEKRGWFVDVVTVPLAAAGERAKRSLQARSLVSRRSFQRLRFDHRGFQRELDRLVALRHFDLVQVEYAFLFGYRIPPGAAVVLDEHNIEYEIQRRTAEVATGPVRRLYNLIDHRKLRSHEERAWRTVDACAVTSARDESTVRAASPETPTAIVPNGVDSRYFTARSAIGDPDTILFFGTISYYPNTEGLVFFLREVFPLVKRARPNARLVVVGDSPPAEIRRWAGPDVTITGAVDDVRPYLTRARVVIAPLRIGGGTRLKIVEAMAMGRPVVSTTLGAEGLAVTPGREILLADDPARFAGEVVHALSNDELATALGRDARAVAERAYDWSRSYEQLERLYGVALSRRDARQREATAASRPLRAEPDPNSSSATP